MSSSELTANVARANDRIRSALTGATSLAALAIVAVAGCYGVHRIQPSLAKPIVVLALGGGWRWGRHPVLLMAAGGALRRHRAGRLSPRACSGGRPPGAPSWSRAPGVGRWPTRSTALSRPRWRTAPDPGAGAPRRADRAAAEGAPDLDHPSHRRRSSWSRPAWCCSAAGHRRLPPARCFAPARIRASSSMSWSGSGGCCARDDDPLAA